MQKLIHSLLIVISILLIIIGILLRSENTISFVSNLLISVGTSIFVALTVAKIFQNFSLKKIDEKFSYWNKKAAQASLSGILGAEIQEELVDNLVKIIDTTGFRRKDYDEKYHFSKNGKITFCKLSVSFTVENFGNKSQTYPYRHELHKGFLFDLGKSLCFEQCKIYDINSNRVLYETDKRKKKETPNTYFFEYPIKLKPNQSVRIISVVKFNINNNFNFFDSFFQPINGVKIKLEHDFTDAVLGFSSAKFWKERFVSEYSDENKLELNYSGVVFPGQGIGIWMHIHSL